MDQTLIISTAITGAVALAGGAIAARRKAQADTAVGDASVAVAQIESRDGTTEQLWAEVRRLSAGQVELTAINNALIVKNAEQGGQIIVLTGQMEQLRTQLLAVTTERDTLRSQVAEIPGLKARITELERRLMEYEPDHKQDPTL